MELGIQADDIILSRIEGVNIDICSPTNNQRGIGAIIIGDDGTYLICGSIKPLESYMDDYKNGQHSNFEKNNANFYKKNESDIIWWIDNHDEKGKHEFSFDKLKIYNLFRDYPYELSSDEIEIFDRENPYWVDFFKDRKKSLEDDALKKLK